MMALTTFLPLTATHLNWTCAINSFLVGSWFSVGTQSIKAVFTQSHEIHGGLMATIRGLEIHAGNSGHIPVVTDPADSLQLAICFTTVQA